MMLTWTPNPVPYDQAFEAIKAAIDAMPAGVKLFINSGAFAVAVACFSILSLTLFPGEFYGQGFSASNLDLLAAFYERYPGYADKTFLSVKGGLNFTTMRPDSSYVSPLNFFRVIA